MPKNTMTIGIRIEDVTKLSCFNEGCQFNLYKECGSYYCNLKYVELNEVGVCFHSLEDENEKTDKT